MTAFRFLRILPAYALNGAGVSIGIAGIYLLVFLVAGVHGALAASLGAVYASLSDTPNAPARTWRRVLTAASIGTLITFGVGILRPYPVPLGIALAPIAFFSALSLAWGPRAGAISLVGVLAFVFSMASPPHANIVELLVATGFICLGAAAYLGWAVFIATRLQPRYRTLALVAVVSATAGMLRSRAAVVATDPHWSSDAPPLEAWIATESLLEEKLQAARDLLFAAKDDAATRRQTTFLLLIIELRDTLMLGQLDLDLLGHDAPGETTRHALAASYHAMADALEVMRDAVLDGKPLPPTNAETIAPRLRDSLVEFAEGDVRRSLSPILLDRTRHVVEDLTRMEALLRAGPDAVPAPPLDREQLQLFVSPEGWPLAALKPHMKLSSPVMRHAIRFASALVAAYFIALALPWTSHPHWLVLSVAVVLRGSLEQTLSRRNIRIAGTVAGCALVLALGQFATHTLSTAVYLGATGLAHAFALANYFVTAVAATVMALLQDHLTNPTGHFAAFERLADTFVGAFLAWGFSYLLPAWERNGIANLVDRLTRALDAMSGFTMRIPEPGSLELPARAARRELYAALSGLAAAAQRSRVEPKRVRVPAYAFVSVLERGHAMMAHLAAIRIMVARRAGDLDPAALQAALAASAEDIHRRLGRTVTPEGDSAPENLAVAGLPSQLPTEALMPWLYRRLHSSGVAATRFSDSAEALKAAVRAVN